MKSKIEKLLRQALLKNGKMEHSLFEYELKEHIDYWYKGLKKDKEEFVFVVTENRGHVAMVLITKEKEIYINEDARDKLMEIWKYVYKKNMELMIPMMADDLVNGILAVNGVKTASSNFSNIWTGVTGKSDKIGKIEANLQAYLDKYKGFLPDKNSD
ncbi:MAG: hypothetical protein KME28_00105 [Pelatocladus maniniholoensis HA4357-MV3]|jgi:hypothetical protein|uniref:Uncharacterized protein n=1 Tax=Pelatocladus maniniholoensis HA4357-MV3 TaxID=1117104 RepID=A0A9E3LRT6_9NOST|nr:hypothetical protein [Pelatocladus maniniholoensis HA4357-MV3]